MPAREIRIVSLGIDNLISLTSQGLDALRETDLLIYDDVLIPDLHAFQLPGVDAFRVSTSPIITMEEIEEDLRLVTEALRLGRRVLRLIADTQKSLRRLEHELRLFQSWRVQPRIIPHRDIFTREASQLKLPWLTAQTQVRILDTARLKGEQLSWQELAQSEETLAVDLGSGSLQTIVDQLLSAGADPHRPEALVAHHPTRDPLCWLTTLDELDELYVQWKTSGATILYIGSWPRAVSSSVHQADFWGPLTEAAHHWVRTGTLAENY